MYIKNFIVVALCLFHQSIFSHLTEQESNLFLSICQWDIDRVTDLLKNDQQLNINALDETGNSYLHYAASYGNIACIKLLLEYGAKINISNHKGAAPLHLAIQNNHLLAVQEFLKFKNIDINAAENRGWSSLHIAIMQDSMPIVQLLLSDPRIVINAENNDGVTPLRVAVENKCIEAIKILLECGADPNITDLTGKNALHAACEVGDFDIVMMLLKSSRCQINSVTHVGMSALAYAALFGDTAIVKEFLQQKNIDVNTIDADGCQPLYIAACGGHYEIIKMLLDAGADVNHANLQGAVALHTACGNSDFKLVELLFKSSKINVNAVDLKGLASIHWVAMKGDVEILKLFLQRSDTNLNIEDFQTMTPLHYAIANNCKDAMRLLIQYCARCDRLYPDELSALSFAASFESVDIVQELLKSLNLDINEYIYHENFQCWTPLDIALEKGHKQLQQFLIERGAIEFRPISVILYQIPGAVGKKDIDKLSSFIALSKKKLKKQILATVQDGFSMSFAYVTDPCSIQIIHRHKIKVLGSFYAPTLPGIDVMSIEDRQLYFVFEKIDDQWFITDTDFCKKLKYFSQKILSNVQDINKSKSSCKSCQSLTEKAQHKVVKNEPSRFVKTEDYTDLQTISMNRPVNILDKAEHDMTIYYPRQHYTAPGDYQIWNQPNEIERVKATSGPW